MVLFPLISCLPPVFYVKRSSSGNSSGLLWRLGRTQFSCLSRVLRDQWTKHLRTALKTHSMDRYSSKFSTGSQQSVIFLMYVSGPVRPNRLLVFINPFGGKKKGRKIYHSLVAPLFELAGISSHVVGKEPQLVS